MSWALSCGTGMFGDYADEWSITMAYAVFIDTLAAVGVQDSPRLDLQVA